MKHPTCSFLRGALRWHCDAQPVTRRVCQPEHVLGPGLNYRGMSFKLSSMSSLRGVRTG